MNEIESILKMSDRDLIRAVLEQMRNAGLRSAEYFALVGRLQGFSDNQTGRTPAELASLVRELREALRQIVGIGHGHGPGLGYTCANIAESALAKSEGV